MENYRRIGQLNRGDYWTLYLVQRKDDGKRYTDKVIDLDEEDVKVKAYQEAHVLSQLCHPCIAEYMEHFTHGNQLHIVMKFYQKGNLADLIKAHKKTKKQFTEAQITGWLLQLALALRYLHNRRILHRDIKTENIFLTSNEMVKLGGLGVCKILDNIQAFTHTFIDTESIKPPEMLQSLTPNYNNKADMWSLGVVLYELVTLEPPFKGVKAIKRGADLEHRCITQYDNDIKVILYNLIKEDYKLRNNSAKLLREPLLRARIKTYLQDKKLDTDFKQLLEEELARRSMITSASDTARPLEPPPIRKAWVPPTTNILDSLARRDPIEQEDTMNEEEEIIQDDVFSSGITFGPDVKVHEKDTA